MRTANVLLADLKQMLDFALECQLIAAKPLVTVKKSKIGGPAVERERTLSQDEVRQLAAQLPGPKLSTRSEAAIWNMLATAVRVGRLNGAVWADDLPAAPRERTARMDVLSRQAEATGCSWASSASRRGSRTCRRPRTSATTPSTSATSPWRSSGCWRRCENL